MGLNRDIPKINEINYLAVDKGSCYENSECFSWNWPTLCGSVAN